MKEGVKVPDKDVKPTKVSEKDKTKSTSSTEKVNDDTKSDSTTAPAFDEGVQASDKDMDEVRITVGSGADAVTMTYGAYQKYKELGTLGVG